MRIYHADTTIAFRSTKEEYGAFSNMCHGYPITINERIFNSSEALYQAFKFSDRPDIQELILSSKNGMGAKIISREHAGFEDQEWNSKRVGAMKLSIHLKHMQHLERLQPLFIKSNGFDIVEYSNNDLFWGCNFNSASGIYQGTNGLGRLLMELRVISMSVKEIHFVPTHELDFKLFGEVLGEKINKNGLIE